MLVNGVGLVETTKMIDLPAQVKPAVYEVKRTWYELINSPDREYRTKHVKRPSVKFNIPAQSGKECLFQQAGGLPVL